VEGAELYQSQTARVKASVRPLIASGPQFHLPVRDADPGPFQGSSGAVPGPMSAYCATHPFREPTLGFLGYRNWGGVVPRFFRLRDVVDFVAASLISYYGYANSFSDGSCRHPNFVARFRKRDVNNYP
jgi:hypothetical protein